MSDLNLMPQEFRIKKEKRIKKFLFILFCILILIILVTGAYIPIYFTYSVQVQNKNVEQDIEELSYVTAEVNKFNTQKDQLQDKISILDSFSNQEIKWNAVLKDLSDIIPSEVSVDNINMTKDGITLQGTSLNQQAIAVFIANIENSKRFVFNNIGSITLNIEANNFKFDMSFKLSNDESKVK